MAVAAILASLDLNKIRGSTKIAAPADSGQALHLLGQEANINRLTEAATKYKGLAVQLVGKEDSDAIPLELLERVIKTERERLLGCVSLFFSLFFFAVFAASALLHLDVSNVFLLENGFGAALSNSVENIVDIPSTWTWLTGSFLPSVSMQTDANGVPLNKSSWNMVLGYNQLTGPVIIEQLRSPKVKCSDEMVSDTWCHYQRSSSTDTFGRQVNVSALIQPPNASSQDYAGGSPSFQERQAFYDKPFSVVPAITSDRRLARTIIPEYERAGMLPSEKVRNDLFRAAIFPNMPSNLMQEYMNYLKQKGWIDAQTKRITIKCLVLNSEVNSPRLMQFVLELVYTRGGGVWQYNSLETVFLQTWSGAASITADVLWVICLSIIALKELYELIKASRRREVTKYLKSLWFLQQLCVLALGIGILVAYAYQRNLRMQVVDMLQQMNAVMAQDPPPERFSDYELLMNRVDAIGLISKRFRTLLGANCMFMMFRLCVGFLSQPRLAVVTKTLADTGVDIFHFLHVFGPTFIAFCMAGHFIFGRRLQDFSSVLTTIGSTFKLMFEGQYTWSDFTQEYYVTALIWVWSVMILLNLIMLNIVLAIVLAVNSKIRQRSGSSEAVWTTLWHLLMQLRYWSRWIPFSTMKKVLPMMPPLVKRADLLQFFPTMCDEQLDRLIHSCKFQEELDTIEIAEGPGSMKMAMSCKLAMDKVQESVKQLHEGSVATTGLQSIPNSKWVEALAKEMSAQNHMMLNLQFKLQQLGLQWKAVEELHGKGTRFQDVQLLDPQQAKLGL